MPVRFPPRYLCGYRRGSWKASISFDTHWGHETVQFRSAGFPTGKTRRLESRRYAAARFMGIPIVLMWKHRLRQSGIS
jgi:hypothetical protein